MIVIEASAMVDALVGEPADPELLALLADEELHAPALLDFEVASALRGHVLGGKLTAERMSEAVDDFVAFDIVRHQGTALLGEVLDLRENFTVYDAAYVVLARALDVMLVTRGRQAGRGATPRSQPADYRRQATMSVATSSAVDVTRHTVRPR